MEKSDFKKMTGEHKAIVEKIIRLNGDCHFIKICDLCPFYKSNSVSDNQYSCPRCDFYLVHETDRNRKVLLAARKFLELFKDDFEEEKMFSKAKVGDRVWDFIYKWGTIKDIDLDVPNDNCMTMFINFDNGVEVRYNLNGEKEYTLGVQTLFWDEIKFEIPEKPFDLEAELKKLEIKKFEYGKKNYYLYWNSTFEGIRIDCTTVADLPLTKYFSENKVLAEFNERIKEQKITKEEFFRVYKNVFGGR